MIIPNRKQDDISRVHGAIYVIIECYKMCIFSQQSNVVWTNLLRTATLKQKTDRVLNEIRTRVVPETDIKGREK